LIKTGIHDIRQVTPGARFKTLFGKDKVLSITLYDRILSLPDAESLAERILLLSADERGARKRTYAARFDAFDEAVATRIRERWDADTPLRVEDVAVSDGRTAHDFFQRLASGFPRLSYGASDFNPRVFVVDDGRLKVTLSRSHRILEITFPPFVFNARPESPLFYPVNHAVRALITRLRVRPLVDRYVSGQVQARTILMFSAQAMNLVKGDHRFQLSEHDVLTPLPRWTGRHVVRAMNILNRSYFGAEQIGLILSHVHDGLGEGGWLITGSNQDAGSQVHGGVYERTESGFRKVWGSGEGSPVEPEILRWQPTRV
jgi:hypothetical protein